MIPREDLPEDAADWSGVSIEFPRLPNDTAASCPVPDDEIFTYVQKESADLDDAERSQFEFLRTALVGDAKYWIWKFTESDGEVDFVTYCVTKDGSTCMGLAAGNGLNAEQFMLADYYDEVYWS